MENPTNENPFPFFLLPEMEDDGHFDMSHPYLQISPPVDDSEILSK